MGKFERRDKAAAKGEFHHKRAKLVVEFDEKSRQDFLTGFSKRKMERRKQALQQLEKEAKDEVLAARKQFRDQIRDERSEILAQAEHLRLAEEEGENDQDIALLAGSTGAKVEQLHDDFSSHQFGSASVTVTTTVPDEDAPFAAAARAAQPSVVGVKLPKHTKIAQSDKAKQAARLRDKLNKKRTRKNMNTASGKPDKSNRRKNRVKNQHK